jgi:excisionase family DNA binding protein
MQASATESPYLTYEEAARYCRCERTTIYRAVKAGKLRASGPGTAIRFRRDELDLWMDLRDQKQSGPAS